MKIIRILKTFLRKDYATYIRLTRAAIPESSYLFIGLVSIQTIEMGCVR